MPEFPTFFANIFCDGANRLSNSPKFESDKDGCINSNLKLGSGCSTVTVTNQKQSPSEIGLPEARLVETQKL